MKWNENNKWIHWDEKWRQKLSAKTYVRKIDFSLSFSEKQLETEWKIGFSLRKVFTLIQIKADSIDQITIQIGCTLFENSLKNNIQLQLDFYGTFINSICWLSISVLLPQIDEKVIIVQFGLCKPKKHV